VRAICRRRCAIDVRVAGRRFVIGNAATSRVVTDPFWVALVWCGVIWLGLSLFALITRASSSSGMSTSDSLGWQIAGIVFGCLLILAGVTW